MTVIPEPPIFSARVGLRLLRTEPVRAILAAVATAPMRVSDLCARMMLESDTTLREQLDQLEEVGAIERKEDSSLSTGEFCLTPAGKDLLEVIGLAGAWLTGRPGRPLSPESDVAWRAIAALGDGWELSLIQHLLLQPSTRAELLETIPSLNKEKAKRMLRRFQGAGLLELLDRADPTPRYVLSEWGRQAVAVLIAIASWERTYLGDAAEPVAAIDGTIALLAPFP